VGESPTRQPLQPEATGAVMEVTKWLKPSDSVSRYTVTARVCRQIAELEGRSFISRTVTHRLVDRRYS
jgi:hypothetical protein